VIGTVVEDASMKVLFVHPYLSVLGGGERVCLHAIKAMLDDGHDVILVSDWVDNKTVESLTGLSVLEKVTHIPYRKAEHEMQGFSAYRTMLRHGLLRSRVKTMTGRVDLELLTQDAVFGLGIGNRTVGYVHFPELVNRRNVGSKSRLFWSTYYAPVKLYWRRNLDKVDLLLCNSEFTRGTIRERWGREALVVYPPVDVDVFRPVPKVDLVVTLGRFLAPKNYEMVLEVAKRLPDVAFEIIGLKEDAAYYERIKASKPDNVALLSDLTRMEVVSHLARAKVYLHTMMNEHFGISIVEAMASGCIPVVHHGGGAVEIVGSSGYAYDTADECACMLRAALTADSDTGALVDRARMFSSENFRRQFRRVISLELPKDVGSSSHS